MSRFAANPKWLIYLPPTMSPCETSKREGFWSIPQKRSRYYHHEGVAQVVCEAKAHGVAGGRRRSAAMRMQPGSGSECSKVKRAFATRARVGGSSTISISNGSFWIV